MKRIFKKYIFDLIFLLGVFLLAANLSKVCRGTFLQTCKERPGIVVGVLLIAVCVDALVRVLFLNKFLNKND